MDIKSCSFDECFNHNHCCISGDKNCNKLICLDGPARGGCFTLEQIDQGVKADPNWGQNVCNSFCDPVNCDETVDNSKVKGCPPAVCKMEECNDPEDSFVCYEADSITGKPIGPGSSWGCSKRKPQREIDCSSRHGNKVCDLRKCGGDYPGQDDCYGRGVCVRFNARGCTGCSCREDEGYEGYFCGECKGGYACIDPNGDRVDSPECLPPNNCEYVLRR